MDDEGARAALQWLDGLPETALVAVAKTLAK
jgi:hypothetical protein